MCTESWKRLNATANAVQNTSIIAQRIHQSNKASAAKQRGPR